MSSNPSKEKGTRAETLIKETLSKYTKLNWQRTPLSGALDRKHGLAGDLYIPIEKNLWCVEVKHYKEDHLTSKILTNKTSQLLEWWVQCITQAHQVNKLPLLIFKFDRSKIFVAFDTMPNTDNYHYVYVNVPPHQFWISLLEDWIEYEDPKFVT